MRYLASNVSSGLFILAASHAYDLHCAINKQNFDHSNHEIRLRVLVKQLQPNEPLLLKGSSLYLSQYEQETSNEVSCSYTHPSKLDLIWKTPNTKDEGWYCNFGEINFKVTKSIYIKSTSQIIQQNKDSYRGYLELLPASKTLFVINHVPMDHYLASLTNLEMSAGFPEEALKAQTIAARSYALSTALDRRSKLWPFDLYNTQIDQVYKGAKHETENSLRIAKETSGQVLTYSGKILKAFYHSSSGGHLEAPLNVWNSEHAQEIGAYEAKPNPYDKNLKNDLWSIQLSKNLGNQLQKVGAIRSVDITQRTEGKRVKQVTIRGERGNLKMTGSEFRNLLGPGWLKSTMFHVKAEKESLVIEGKGWGHGVGMSQWGAKNMAASGSTAREILKFYYPKAKLSIYGSKKPSIPLSTPSTETFNSMPLAR